MDHNRKRAYIREALITGDPELEQALLNNPYFAVEFDNLCHLLPSMVRGICHQTKYQQERHQELVDKIVRSAVIDPILLSNSRTDTRNPSCVKKWPECSNGDYNPECCRFPKSCSC